MRSVLVLFTLLATVVAGLGLPAPAAAARPAAKVAVIVGPVGEELTPVYISLAETAAEAAEERGATVTRAYSPDADEESVLRAVRGANIVIYFGHGVGSPNPYSATPSPLTTNGWGLNGPNRKGDHSDSFSDGTLAYYGETWIAENARPAPGWVMIYSNACYAPGAGEGQHEPASRKVAADRVSAYSRAPLADLGASAYFATDFFEGATHLVGALLDGPSRTYRDIFMSEPRFEDDALFTRPHATVAGAETWLHRSRYFEGKLDYWYAFAGDPDASLAGRPTAAVPRGAPRPLHVPRSGAGDRDSRRIGHRDGVVVLRKPRMGGQGHDRAAARDRRQHPGRRADLCPRLRGPMRHAAGRRFLPLLRRHGRAARRESVACGVARDQRHTARGGPHRGRDHALAGCGQPVVGAAGLLTRVSRR